MTGLKFKSLIQMKYNAGKAPTLQAAFSCVSQQDVAKMADKAASQFQPRGQSNDTNLFAGCQREADPLICKASTRPLVGIVAAMFWPQQEECGAPAQSKMTL